MKKIKLLCCVNIFCSLILHAQNVGIKTTTPQSALDINGDISLRKATLTLPAGGSNNVDISTNKYSVYDFAGGALTGGAQIFGFTGGTDGRMITIFNNSTTAAMQIMDETHPGSASSLAANRIVTGSGNGAVIYQNGSVTLRYDAQKQRWTIIGSNYTDGLSASPPNTWLLGGNSGTNSTTNFMGTTDNTPLKFRIKNISAGIIDSTSFNTAIGFRTLDAIAIGINNTAMGYGALKGNTLGNANTANGSSALTNNTTGTQNTAIGYKSLTKNTTGNNNIAIGFEALTENIAGEANTATGVTALASNTTGNYNTANGTGTLTYNTTGNYNTANGYIALSSNTTGDYNTANGYNALSSNTIGTDNTANGSYALYSNTIGTDNTANGSYALYSNTTGNYNAANGSSALYSNTIGSDNTANGFFSLSSNTTGHDNTANGRSALYSNTNGHYNTAIGSRALYNNFDGDNNIAIGDYSGTTASFNNTVSIGNDGFLNAYHNQVFLGNLSSGWIGGHVGWSIYSDGRMKKNIKEDVRGLEFIKRLRPVTYNRDIDLATTLTGNKQVADYPQKYDAEKIKTSGFIAQEVEQAAIASGYDFDGVQKPKDEKSLYSVCYASFVVPLVKAVQEQQQIIDKQQTQIDELKNLVTQLINKQQVSK
jgi:trimeric autotransporter adhesin